MWAAIGILCWWWKRIVQRRGELWSTGRGNYCCPQHIFLAIEFFRKICTNCEELKETRTLKSILTTTDNIRGCERKCACVWVQELLAHPNQFVHCSLFTVPHSSFTVSGGCWIVPNTALVRLHSTTSECTLCYFCFPYALPYGWCVCVCSALCRHVIVSSRVQLEELQQQQQIPHTHICRLCSENNVKNTSSLSYRHNFLASGQMLRAYSAQSNGFWSAHLQSAGIERERERDTKWHIVSYRPYM